MYRKLLMRVVAGSMLAMGAQAALLGPTDSSAFAHRYNGNEIFDGSSLVNKWSLGASGGTTADLSLNGSNLLYTYSTKNGWLEHDDGTTPWEIGLGGDWTVEVKAKISSTNPSPYGEFVMWTADGANQQILVAGEGGVNQYRYDYDALGDNTDEFHTFRIAYVASDNAYYFYRDNVQVMQNIGVPSGLGDGSYARRASTSNTRLLVGDCCAWVSDPQRNVGGIGAQVEYEYVRYDMTGAFAPVPEPSTFALLGLAVGGLPLLRRRK